LSPVDGPESPPPGGDGVESTASLLARTRAGDRVAVDELAARYLPRLQRLAHGRLPLRARDVLDTEDLVHSTLIKALNHVQTFVPQHEGAFLGYLRQTLLNEIRQEIRRVDRRPERDSLPEDVTAAGRSPLDDVIGQEILERYEAALAHLPETQRAAVLLRLEFGFTHEEVAAACGCPSANAARMMVKRALLELAAEMDHVADRT
jgi:RNA polymerase sigma factor (sigma-70 family)